MPKRSNDFQRMIRTIYDALSHVDGASVKEGEDLYEPDGTPREIDVLLEGKFFDETLRIAVECRDRSRNSDIEWIDALIGKFINLNVNKIIAVSRRGFSPSARSKAERNGIETKSLKQCESENWPDQFIRVGAAELTLESLLTDVEVTFVPPLSKAPSVKTYLKRVDGTRLSLDKLLSKIREETLADGIRFFITSELLPRCKNLSDLSLEHAARIECELREPFYIKQKTSKSELKKVIFTVNLVPRVKKATTEHLKYGDRSIVTIATIDETGAGFNIIQTKGVEKLFISKREGGAK